MWMVVMLLAMGQQGGVHAVDEVMAIRDVHKAALNVVLASGSVDICTTLALRLHLDHEGVVGTPFQHGLLKHGLLGCSAKIPKVPNGHW